MDKYFVLMQGDVSPEKQSTIIKGCILTTSELKRLSKNRFCFCFGEDLSSEIPKMFKDCATVIKVTDEEIKVLEKFGVADFSSGYFYSYDEV